MKHLSPDQIDYFLPCPPPGYHHEVEQVGKLTHKVWLVHERNYDYACGKQVKTIWGYIKHNKVYCPKDNKTAYVKSCCDLVDAYKLSCYTSIVPKTTDLTHLI